MNRKKVEPTELVPMDIFTKEHPIAIDLVYASGEHPENIFGTIYRDGARLWMHKDLAAITLLAARLCERENPFLLFEIKDSLRTVEAQTLMQQSPIVQKNPHWCEEPNRLLSPPGAGAHPRAMAVDVVLVLQDSERLDMGTAFDHLSENPDYNPAARSFDGLAETAATNRALLEGAMTEAARRLGLPLLPLASEWWDFRFPEEVYGTFEPLWDADLPGQMRMTTLCGTTPLLADFPEQHFVELKEQIEEKILED